MTLLLFHGAGQNMLALGQGLLRTGPSAICHATDGVFTACSDGRLEWSDITPQYFAELEVYLYVDQADLEQALATPTSPVDTLMLMYDACGATVPLGPDQYVLVHFDTVETENGGEKLESYVLHIFTDGTIIFFEDGVLQPPGRASVVDHMSGDAGFGTSPNCLFDHVMAEFQVRLTAAGGGSYSPDPLFWGSLVEEEKCSIGPHRSYPKLRQDLGLEDREGLPSGEEFERGERLVWTPEQEQAGALKDRVFRLYNERLLPFILDNPLVDFEFQPTSAYRPATYQAHFRDILEHAQELERRLSGASARLVRACSQIIEEVNRHALQHFGLTQVRTVTLPGGFSLRVPKFACPNRGLVAGAPAFVQDCPHVSEIAADIRIRGGCIEQNERQICVEKIIDEIAKGNILYNPSRHQWEGQINPQDIGLRRCVRDDRVHWEIFPSEWHLQMRKGCPRGGTLAATGNSHIAILVTDPLGRRIGFDPALGSVVNEIGQDGSYSGQDTHPQTISIDEISPGPYLIAGIGTGTESSYRVTLSIGGEDSSFIEDTTVSSGIVRAGQSIRPVIAKISAEGELQLLYPPYLVLTPSSSPPNGQVRVTGSGFTSNAAFTASFDNAEVASGTINQDGMLSFSFFIPVPTGIGQYPITATDGVDLSANATFRVTPPLDELFVSSNSFGEITRINLATNETSVIVTGLDSPEDGAVNPATGQVYFTESCFDFCRPGITGKINRFNPDGSGFENVLSSSTLRVEGLSFDSAGNLYMNTRDNLDGRIYRIAGGVPGNNPEPVTAPFTTFGEGSLIDSHGNLWAIDRDGGRVLNFGSTFSPANSGSVIKSGLDFPWGIAEDSKGRIYVSLGFDQIIRFNPDGTGEETFVTELAQPKFLDFDSLDNLYAAEVESGAIVRISPSGEKTVLATMDVPLGLALKKQVSPFDFGIFASLPSLSLDQGQSASFAVTVIMVGSPEPVRLSLSSLPNGVVATFTPNVLDSSGISILSVNASFAAPGGTFSITVTASSDTMARSVTLDLSVSRLDFDDDGALDELDNCPGTANPDQKDSNLNGFGDLCETVGLQQTAAFFNVLADGSTTIEPWPVAVSQEPEPSEILGRIISFRLAAGLTKSVTQLTSNLVESLVRVERVPMEDANDLVRRVVERVDGGISPAWPIGSALTASLIGPTSLTLTWTAAIDNTGVVNYRVYQGSSPVATLPEDVRSYRVTGLKPGTTYTFKMEAGDAADNWGSTGPSLTVTTPYAWTDILTVAFITGAVVLLAAFLFLRKRKRGPHVQSRANSALLTG